MSAFMHDSAHVDALVHAHIRHGITDDDGTAPDVGTTLGRMLLLQNAEAVAWRYNLTADDEGSREYAGYLAQANAYRYDPDDAGKPWRAFPGGAIRHAIRGYVYQCEEHPAWDDSEARRFCDDLDARIVDDLAGSDLRSWAITATPVARA